MIMQAVSSLSLNVLMVFSLALSLTRWTINTTTTILTIVWVWEERISQMNNNKRNSDEKKIFIDWWWESVRLYPLNFHFFFLKTRKKRGVGGGSTIVRIALLLSLFCIDVFVFRGMNTKEKKKKKKEKKKKRPTSTLMSIPKTPMYTWRYYYWVLLSEAIRYLLVFFLLNIDQSDGGHSDIEMFNARLLIKRQQAEMSCSLYSTWQWPRAFTHTDIQILPTLVWWWRW